MANNENTASAPFGATGVACARPVLFASLILALFVIGVATLIDHFHGVWNALSALWTGWMNVWTLGGHVGGFACVMAFISLGALEWTFCLRCKLTQSSAFERTLSLADVILSIAFFSSYAATFWSIWARGQWPELSTYSKVLVVVLVPMTFLVGLTRGYTDKEAPDCFGVLAGAVAAFTVLLTLALV